MASRLSKSEENIKVKEKETREIKQRIKYGRQRELGKITLKNIKGSPEEQ